MELCLLSPFSITAALLWITAAIANVQTVTITAPSSIPSEAPSWTSHRVFTSAIIDTTNSYRHQHSAAALTWNKTLADFASSFLDARSSRCVFAHSGGPYGENLAEGYANVSASVKSWGDERQIYDWWDPGFGEQTGHFTQLVWKSTRQVGCAARLCGQQGWFLACEYWPRGNVEGEYETEVGEQVSMGRREMAGMGWDLSGLMVFWMVVSKVI